MKEIIHKYLSGTATSSEKSELLHWLKNKENRKEFAVLKWSWRKEMGKETFPGGGEDTWSKIEHQLFEKSISEWQKSVRIGHMMRYAAIFFLVTTLTGMAWFFINKPEKPVVLNTTVIAENGHMSTIILPDGTKVWLNSASTLSYSNFFGKNNRSVKLNGEAYFDVVKNEELPLLVNCGELMVRVTGTRFNVNAYPENKEIGVVLEEGGVEISRPGYSRYIYSLEPGERAVFDVENKKLNVSEVNTAKYTSWKEGIINIYDQPLDKVVLKLKTRYNQEFIVDEKVKQYHYTFTIKNEPLQEILALIEKITPVKAEQSGMVITLKQDMKRMNKGVN